MVGGGRGNGEVKGIALSGKGTKMFAAHTLNDHSKEPTGTYVPSLLPGLAYGHTVVGDRRGKEIILMLWSGKVTMGGVLPGYRQDHCREPPFLVDSSASWLVGL